MQGLIKQIKERFGYFLQIKLFLIKKSLIMNNLQLSEIT